MTNWTHYTDAAGYPDDGACSGGNRPGRSSADFAAALADFNAEPPRFPGRNQPGALGDAIYELSGAHLEAMEVANPAIARTDVETELARIRVELAAFLVARGLGMTGKR